MFESPAAVICSNSPQFHLVQNGGLLRGVSSMQMRWTTCRHTPSHWSITHFGRWPFCINRSVRLRTRSFSVLLTGARLVVFPASPWTGEAAVTLTRDYPRDLR